MILKIQISKSFSMLCSLVSEATLHQTAEFKLILRGILLSQAANSSKISVLASLKSTLQLAIRRQSKRTEQLSLENEHTSNQAKRKANEGCNQITTLSAVRYGIPAVSSMRLQHRLLVSKVCSHYQLRNHLSINLHELQTHLSRLSSKYQRQQRRYDEAKQALTIQSMKEVHCKMKQVLCSLVSLNRSLAVEYQMIGDNIKLLKVKNVTLRAQLTTMKQTKVSSKSILPTGSKLQLRSSFFSNQNSNQILINL